MKAVICTKYGPPEVLQIQDVDRPACKDSEILIRIMATSVNSGDVKVRGLATTGFKKVIMQLVLGISKPRRPILGNVFSGIVESKGNKVSKFKVGDKVFGMTGFKFGTYAEYICMNERSTVLQMPANASFEQAASLPFGWHTAIYFLKKAGIEKHKKPKVLIYGATGSVGMAAIQLAQYFGAILTAVCSSEGKPLMEIMGVKDVIAYDREDFTQTTHKFDIIFDTVGKTSKTICKKLLNRGGNFVTVGGLDVAREHIMHLKLIQELFEKGKCSAVIDKIYPFTDIVAAHTYVDTGRKKGDVVLKN